MRVFTFVPCHNTSKYVTLLLMTMALMILYVLNYNVAYPYSDHCERKSWFRSPSSVSRQTMLENKDNETLSACDVCAFYDVRAEAKDLGYKCISTATRPRTTVCVYDEWTDMYISHDLIYTGVWEPQVLADFKEILGHNRKAGVIDLGANIGFYTLLAAKMGHKVIAVEPYVESIYRIHRALYLEHLGDHVFVLENGISDKHEQVTLKISGNNQGDNQLRHKVRPCHGSCPKVIDTIVLDDLVRVVRDNFSIAILKMDIQGYEHKAFKQASVLFDTIDIPYIFMEWFVMKSFHENLNYTSPDKKAVEEMLSFLFTRHYRPYTLTQDGSKPLDPCLWYDWPFDIIWKRLPNKVEKQTILSNFFRVWPPS